MIKRKQRKNPKFIDELLLSYLHNAINYGSLLSLIRAMIYYNQGFKCDDCELTYRGCDCEECPNCGFQRCLCDLGFTLDDYGNATEKERLIYTNHIKQKAKEFAKQILTKEQLKKLYESQ